jgi:uncharacterized protein with HEPN domain
MSSRDARAYLHDIVEACDGIRSVIGTMDCEAYRSDLKSRLATERELISIGEALARLVDSAPEMCADWPVPLRSVIGLRNILVHGYFKVDDALLFEIASEQVPLLRHAAERTLDPPCPD